MTKIVNQKQLAEIIGITDRHVRRLEEQGIINKTGNGKYDLTSCIDAYYKHKYRPPSNAEYEREHALHEKVKREIAEIELMELKGNMHKADDIKRIMTGMLINFKGKMLTIPGTVSARLINQSNPNVIDNILTKEVKVALQELSEYDAKLFLNTDK